MEHETPAVRVLTAGESWTLLRLATALALDAAREELIRLQERRDLAEAAVTGFDPSPLDRDPRR